MPQPASNIAVCLMGPTATGKTDIALALAARLPIDLVSVDSAMVYRGMDIGTGKPSCAEQARHPHRLIDIRDPWEQYSAGEFAADAAAAIRDSQVRGRIPFLVGGTMLYFRSLIDGLSPLPAADPALRARLDARAVVEGWPALHRELAELDPVAAARISPTDRQRIQRALEVCLLAREPLSAIHARSSAAPSRHLATQLATQPSTTWFKVGIRPAERANLAGRIARRLATMLERGFKDEVERLLALPDMHPERPALRAVGYRQLASHVLGRCGRAEAESAALAATRQLAKRQLTWLRREHCDAWLDMESGSLAGDLEALVRQRMAADAISGSSG